MMPSRKRSLRRALLATLGATALFGPAVFSGCATSFTPPGKVDTLRVLAVTIDNPYVYTCLPPAEEPKCKGLSEEDCTALCESLRTANFEMEVHDAYGVNEQGSERLINILWIGGCFNPEGDQYALCAEPLIKVFEAAGPALAEAIQNGEPPKFPPGLPVGYGKKFSITVPDIVSSRPKPDFGPHYGIGYVFFLACDGRFGIVESDPSAAGTFPIGCLDGEGRPVSADSFVPGYTQVYSFADGRLNENPVVTALTMDGEPLPEDFAAIPTVPTCDVPPQDRNLPPSCSREDPFTACQTYEIKVQVPEDVAEVDPDATGSKDEILTETVWVSYHTDTGDFDGDIKLVNDPTTGYSAPHEVKWIPPAVPGLATIWAVVRDARGGSNVVVRTVRVE